MQFDGEIGIARLAGGRRQIDAIPAHLIAISGDRGMPRKEDA
jgi:hypothetical protein